LQLGQENSQLLSHLPACLAACLTCFTLPGFATAVLAAGAGSDHARLPTGLAHCLPYLLLFHFQALLQQYMQLGQENSQLQQHYQQLCQQYDDSLPVLLALQAQLHPLRSFNSGAAAVAEGDLAPRSVTVAGSSSILAGLHPPPQSATLITGSSSGAGAVAVTAAIPASANTAAPAAGDATQLLQELHALLPHFTELPEEQQQCVAAVVAAMWGSLAQQMAALLPELEALPADHPLKQPGQLTQQQQQQQQQQAMDLVAPELSAMAAPLHPQQQQQQQQPAPAGMQAEHLVMPPPPHQLLLQQQLQALAAADASASQEQPAAAAATAAAAAAAAAAPVLSLVASSATAGSFNPAVSVNPFAAAAAAGWDTELLQSPAVAASPSDAAAAAAAAAASSPAAAAAATAGGLGPYKALKRDRAATEQQQQQQQLDADSEAALITLLSSSLSLSLEAPSPKQLKLALSSSSQAAAASGSIEDFARAFSFSLQLPSGLSGMSIPGLSGLLSPAVSQMMTVSGSFAFNGSLDTPAPAAAAATAAAAAAAAGEASMAVDDGLAGAEAGETSVLIPAAAAAAAVAASVGGGAFGSAGGAVATSSCAASQKLVLPLTAPLSHAGSTLAAQHAVQQAVQQALVLQQQVQDLLNQLLAAGPHLLYRLLGQYNKFGNQSSGSSSSKDLLQQTLQCAGTQVGRFAGLAVSSSVQPVLGDAEQGFEPDAFAVVVPAAAAAAAAAQSTAGPFSAHCSGSNDDGSGTACAERTHWQQAWSAISPSTEQQQALQQLLQEAISSHAANHTQRQQLVTALAMQCAKDSSCGAAAAATCSSAMSRLRELEVSAEAVQASCSRDFSVVRKVLQRLWGSQVRLLSYFVVLCVLDNMVFAG
jgi:hypothetical protein